VLVEGAFVGLIGYAAIVFFFAIASVRTGNSRGAMHESEDTAAG
jgi:hypothetical protein